MTPDDKASEDGPGGDGDAGSPWRIPDPMVLIFGVLVVAVILTHMIPAGSFEREVVDGTTRVVPDSYERVDGNPAAFFDIFLSIPKGMIVAAQYLFIVFIAGGLFKVLSSTGALENSVGTLVKRVGVKNRTLIIWITVFVFGFFGVAVGFENNIALVPIALLVARAIGGNRLIGVGMAVGGIGVGFALSPINPYTVGVSQDIADLPMFSGYALRLGLVLCALTVVAAYLSRAVDRHGPDASDDDSEGLSKPLHEYSLSRHDAKVLVVFVGGLAVMLFGVFSWDWYINEIAAMFLAIAVFVGIVCRMPGDVFIDRMMTGASSVTSGALIIGLAASIQVVLEEAQIIDTVVDTLAGALSILPVALAAVVTTLVQGSINFFIPSGSGQAMVTMPILIPLGDLMGITRQTMILAFQVGDGLTNLIVPTAGGTLAMLALGKVSYSDWLRFCFPMIALIYAMSWAFIVLAVYTGYS